MLQLAALVREGLVVAVRTPPKVGAVREDVASAIVPAHICQLVRLLMCLLLMLGNQEMECHGKQVMSRCQVGYLCMLDVSSPHVRRCSR